MLDAVVADESCIGFISRRSQDCRGLGQSVARVRCRRFATEVQSPVAILRQARQSDRTAAFNLMFKTLVGASATEDDVAYLRPETAQGIFVQFKNVVDTTRVKIPFGIGNIGTSPSATRSRRGTSRSARASSSRWNSSSSAIPRIAGVVQVLGDFRMEWWQSIGLAGTNLILRPSTTKDELSHYSKGAPATSSTASPSPPPASASWRASPTAATSTSRSTRSTPGSNRVLRHERGETLPNGGRRAKWYLPHCIEPAAGLDRGVLALLCEAYTKDASRPSPEFMKFHPRMAPIKAAVFPLVNKDGMPEVAEKLHAELACRKIGSSSRTPSSRSASATPAWTKPAARSASPSTARRCRTRR